MTSGSPALRVGGAPTTLVVTLVPLAVGLNFAANWVAGLLRLPIYLDTVGTFLASVLVGPWWGAFAGVLTNVVGVVPNGPTNLLFAPVNVAAALIWGYGIRRLALGRSEVTFFLLAAVVGLVTGALATPIVIFLGYATGHPSDLLTASLLAVGLPLEGAVLASSSLSSVADKIVSAYLGLAVTVALPAAVAARAVVPAAPGGRRLAVAAVGMLVGLGLAFLVALPAAAG